MNKVLTKEIKLVIYEEIVEGFFIEESKNRFICTVLIENQIHECYVPIASKLKNYINLKNKRVLLLRNQRDTSRTKYSIFAVQYYGKYILLNIFLANKITEEWLIKHYRSSNIYKEKYVDDYKTDFLVMDEKKIIVEVKGVIAARRNILFPTVYSKRAIEQLNKISKLLDNGCKAQYFIVSLSPIVKSIKINNLGLYLEYYELLIQCINKGMTIKGFNLKLSNKSVGIGKELEIIV